VRKNLRRAEKLLRNMSVVAEIQSAIAIIRKHASGTRGGLEQLAHSDADVYAARPGSGRASYFRRYGPGTILDVLGDTDYEFPASGIDAGRYVTVLQAELRAIASRLVMPEFMLTSDASNANYASTMVAEGPAMRMFDRMQQDMIEDDLGVMEHVLESAVQGGRLPATTLALVEVRAVPPTLAVRDRLQEAQADQILVRNGAMSVETMAMRNGLSPEHEQQLIARRAAVREHNFNPDEPRDERGRWTTGGSQDSGCAAADGTYSPEAAKKAFDKEKARSDIAFKYPKDGCYARAHLMCKDIKNSGGNPGKVWAFPKDPADPLHAKTPHDPAGHVEWRYHVAPTVPIKGADGKVKDMVVDPSLFDEPVTIEQWNGAMKPTGGGGISNSRTKLGEAPVLPDGTRAPGSGYGPGEDPSGDLDKHAAGVMKDYKSREYTPPGTAKPKKQDEK